LKLAEKANTGEASTCHTEIRRKTKREEREVAMMTVLAGGKRLILVTCYRRSFRT
jgi:hypothetical protein